MRFHLPAQCYFRFEFADNSRLWQPRTNRLRTSVNQMKRCGLVLPSAVRLSFAELGFVI